MLNIRRKTRKGITIIFLIALLLITLLSHFSYPRQFEGIQKISLSDDSLNESQLYFETHISYQLRLQLQAKIKFGGLIKKGSPTVFNSREGYYEPYLDSLPIIRDDIPDFMPELCQNDTTVYISKTKVSVIMNYHNELLSLLLRSVYSVIASIPPHNFHELILIDDGSNLTTHQVCQLNVNL